MADTSSSTQIDFMTSNVCDASEMRQLLWQNKIAARVELSPFSNARETQAMPKFMFMHRVHHPIFYYSAIHEHFEQYCPAPRNGTNIFLTIRDDNQVDHIIPWGIPFGVTFDLIFGNKQDQQLSEMSKNSDGKSTETFQSPTIVLITAHYGPPPASDPSEVIAIDTANGVIETAKSNFKFTLKEALLIRQKNTFVLTEISMADQERFFDSFVSLDEATFFPILRTLFFKAQIQSSPSSPDFVPFRMPLRLYVSNYPGRVQIAETIASERQTLGSTLSRYFPKIISECDDAYEIKDAKYNSLFILVNGIEVSLETPLIFLNNHFLHFDGFLYVVLKY